MNFNLFCFVIILLVVSSWAEDNNDDIIMKFLNLNQNGEPKQDNFNNTAHRSLYSVDYFTINVPNWITFFNYVNFNEEKPLNFLEIGSLEGRSTVWQLENILLHPDSRITCVDTWEGSSEHTEDLKRGLYERFLNNISPYQNKVRIVRGFSSHGLKLPHVRNETYDFIYIDAAHRARNVLEDAVLSFPLLKFGGILAFDDYAYGGTILK